MPEPPSERLFIRYVLENPYPLGIGLIVVGLIFAWLALRDGRLERLRIAAIPVAIGAATLVTGWFVETAGERSRVVVRDMIDAVAGGDMVGAMGHLSDDVRLHFGSTRNPARDIDGIRAALARFDASVIVDDNRITAMRAYTTSSDTATVHTGCWTETSRWGPGRTQWVLEVARTDDGPWRVGRITFVTVNGVAPPSGW